MTTLIERMMMTEDDDKNNGGGGRSGRSNYTCVPFCPLSTCISLLKIGAHDGCSDGLKGFVSSQYSSVSIDIHHCDRHCSYPTSAWNPSSRPSRRWSGGDHILRRDACVGMWQIGKGYMLPWQTGCLILGDVCHVTRSSDPARGCKTRPHRTLRPPPHTPQICAADETT